MSFFCTMNLYNNAAIHLTLVSMRLKESKYFLCVAGYLEKCMRGCYPVCVGRRKIPENSESLRIGSGLQDSEN